MIQAGVIGMAVAALGCIGAILLWPYLNMIAEVFIDLGMSPIAAIMTTWFGLTLLAFIPAALTIRGPKIKR